MPKIALSDSPNLSDVRRPDVFRKQAHFRPPQELYIQVVLARLLSVGSPCSK